MLSIAALFVTLLIATAWITLNVQADAGVNPIVGTWTISSKDPSGQVVPSTMMTFHADGTVIELDADGTILLGAWQATGERTAIYTVEMPHSDGSGSGFTASVTVSDDGNSWLPPQGTTLEPGEGAKRLMAGAPQMPGPMGSPTVAATGTPGA